MQVQRIQNNDYNQIFGAKFSIKGDIEEIPQKALKRWTDISKSIGNDRDEILVNIEKELYDGESSLSSSWCCNKNIYTRNVAISSYLNNKLDVNIIQPYYNLVDIFCTGMTRPNPKTSDKARLGRTIDSISKYLLDLKNSK